MAARPISERLDERAELNSAIAHMQAASDRRRHPDYDDRQVFLAPVRRRHGDELAFGVWSDAASVER